MAVNRTVKGEIADPGQGATLDELAAFVEEAKASGVPGDARPIVVVRFGTSRIKKIEVKG